MRIDNSTNPVNPKRPTDAKAPKASSETAGGVRGQSLTTVDPKSIDSLLALVSNSSEIRESVVNDIKTKVKNGEFLARQSAVETATAILDL